MPALDILFWTFVVIVSSWLLWELIPDGLKSFWKYQGELHRDKREGRKRKYSFTWRNGRGR